MKKTNFKKSNYDWKVFIILSLAVIIVEVIYYFVIQGSISTPDKQGQFGDTFGALTALFSGFAFAGMITAIVLQTKELGFQREELELTRKVLEESAKAQEELVNKQLFSAQIQGLGSILNSYATSAGNATHHISRDRMDQQAARYNHILENLLIESGLDLAEKSGAEVNKT